MTQREIAGAQAGCMTVLGYVPTEQEGLAVSKEEPGLVKLFMHVLNNQFEHRFKDKEIYDYSKKPSTKELINDKDKRNLGNKEKRNKDGKD